MGFGLRKPELFLSDRIAVQLRSQTGENSSAIDLQKNYLLSQIYSLAIKTFSPSFTSMRLCCPCLLRNPVNIWRHDPVFLKTVQFNSKLPIPDFSSNFWDGISIFKAGSRSPSRKSRRILGGIGVGFLRTRGVGVRFFFIRLRLRMSNWILTRACGNGTISFETFIKTDNSCYAPRFPLITDCYKIIDRQTWFTLYEGSEILESSESENLGS